MSFKLSLPTKKESIIVVVITAVIITLTAIFVGYRPEHNLMFGLFLVLFFASAITRKLAVALILLLFSDCHMTGCVFIPIIW